MHNNVALGELSSSKYKYDLYPPLSLSNELTPDEKIMKAKAASLPIAGFFFSENLKQIILEEVERFKTMQSTG